MSSSRAALLPVLLTLGLLTGCGSEAESAPGSAGGATTIENCGRELSFDSAPESVLVIGGEAATIVEAAGAASSVTTFLPLVGEPLGEAEEALAGAEQLPLQTASEMSREVILAQDPDLVVTFGLSNMTPEDLQASGIETYVIAGYCGGFGAGQSEVEDPIAGVLDDVRTLGTLMGTEDEAEQAATDLQERVDAVGDRFADAPGSSALAVFAVDPESALGAYGGRSMIHQQMDLLGLDNVFADQDERYFEPTIETVVDAAPVRIIALYEAGDTTEDDARAAVTERPELAGVPAVADDEVVALDFYYSGHGTLAVDGLEDLADLVSGGS